MEYTVIQKNIPSTDGKHTLRGVVYEPVGEKKAIFHIVHGMCEYIGRYDGFMRKLASLGYVCCGYTHIGHKDTSDDSDLGFFSENGGYIILTDDVHEFGESVKRDYPDLKYVLMGHSMGSFVVRLTASKYPDYLDALIIMGTAGPNPAAGLGIALTNVLKKTGRGRKVSKTVYSMAFGTYNNRTEKLSEYDWLTHDRNIIDAYASDRYCTFKFTNSAMNDLIRMNRDCNKKACMDAYRSDMPILMVAGDEDPVGSYGEGVKKVYGMLKDSGKTDVEIKLYPGMRHEILNETGREQVESDIIAWTDKVIG